MRLTLGFLPLAFLGFSSSSPSPSSSVSFFFLVVRFFGFSSSPSSFLAVGGMSSSATWPTSQAVLSFC